MQDFEDPKMMEQNILHQISAEDREKEENDRRQLLQSTVTTEDGIKKLVPGLEDQIFKTTRLQVILDGHKISPLVGVEYIIELSDSSGKEPTYTCVLCDKRNDPRTLMAHFTSYNHRLAYLDRHFPTVSRAIVNLPHTLKGSAYKKGINQISVQVCKAIEQTLGRLKPQRVDKDLFEQNRIQIVKRVNQEHHYRETPELTFMDAFDTRWVTDFDAMVAELTLKEQKEKEELQRIEDLKKENLRKKKEKKRISKAELRKPGFKTRRRGHHEKSDKPKRVNNGDRSSSLSSISSSSSSSSSSRSRSHTPDPKKSKSRTRLPKVWDIKYKEEVKRCEEALEKDLKFHKKYPEKHPAYPEEWKRFWNRRSKELQADGKDTTDYDFKPEWIEFWNERMLDLHNEELEDRKEEIMKKVKSEMASEFRRNRSPARKSRTWDCDRGRRKDRDHYGHSKYPFGGSPMSKYSTPYSFSKRRSSSPPAMEEVIENLEVVGLLRLLTALERQLDSLGPKIVALLSKALAAEKAKPNSAEELLFDEEVCILLETVKEKLKGQLLAGVIDKVAIGATKNVIQNTARLLHNATERKKKKDEQDLKMRKQQELLEKSRPSRSEIEALSTRAKESVTVEKKSDPVSVPGVGAVDKVAIAQQIATALLALGKTNISNEELETLTNAVVGMAEASKNTDKPVTAADFVRSLTGDASSGNIETDTATVTIATEPVTAADTESHTLSAIDTYTTTPSIVTTTTTTTTNTTTMYTCTHTTGANSNTDHTFTASSSSYIDHTFTTSSISYPTDSHTESSKSPPAHTFNTASGPHLADTFTTSFNSHPIHTFTTRSNSHLTDTLTTSAKSNSIHTFVTSSDSLSVNTFTTSSSPYSTDAFSTSPSSYPTDTLTTNSSTHPVNTFTTRSESHPVHTFSTSSIDSLPVHTFATSSSPYPTDTSTTSPSSFPANTTFTTSSASYPTDTFTTSSNSYLTNTFTTNTNSYPTRSVTTSFNSHPVHNFTTSSNSYPSNTYTTSSSSRPIHTYTTSSSSYPANNYTTSSNSHPPLTTRSGSYPVHTFTTSSNPLPADTFSSNSNSLPVHPTSSSHYPTDTFVTDPSSYPSDTFTTSSGSHPTNIFTTSSTSYPTDTFTTSTGSYPNDIFTTSSSSYHTDTFTTAKKTESVITTSTISSATSSSDSSSSSSSSHDSEDESSRAESVKRNKARGSSYLDLKTQLQNFQDLSADEQHRLIGFLKNLEATDLAKVERLRAFVNVEPSKTIPPPAPKYPIIPLDDFSVQAETRKSPTPPRPAPAPKVPIISLDDFPVPTQTWRTVSPFSIRLGTQKPSDKPPAPIKVISSFSWKPKVDIFAPKLDMFAEPDDDEEKEQQQQKEKEKEKEKPKIQFNNKWDLSDDDDDYSFEDIYKAADKKVKENEEAKKRTFSSRSRSKSPRSWTSSRSRSPAYKKHPFNS